MALLAPPGIAGYERAEGRNYVPQPGVRGTCYRQSVVLTATLRTDSCLHAVWDREHFSDVMDYPTWQAELLEDSDLGRHISHRHLVPINIHTDGAYDPSRSDEPG